MSTSTTSRRSRIARSIALASWPMGGAVAALAGGGNQEFLPVIGGQARAGAGAEDAGLGLGGRRGEKVGAVVYRGLGPEQAGAIRSTAGGVGLLAAVIQSRQ